MKKETAALFLMICVVTLLVAGCDCQRELATCRKQNQILTQRITELEDQLRQADPAGAETSVETKKTPVVPSGLIYTVVPGDSLWSIAKEQLGNGTRYPEILTLNPHISPNIPMDVGTVLKMPKK